MTKKKQKEIQALLSEGFARLPQVLYVLGISKTSFWAGIKEGRFPKPVKLGSRMVGWPVDEIRALIKELSYARADDYDE